ncbi:MAG: hypothetical protein EU549_04675 [Promethearchaeota archaeon]|nr:MAG: hypothetical protein EU549_04675 [Candidatus Lokiarchaeota archaeon]
MVLIELIDILFGLLSLVTVIFAFVVGIKILSKYKSFKDKNFIYVGLMWIGIYSPWWSSSLSFLLMVFSNNTVSLTLGLYFIFALGLVPFFMIVWLIAFTDMVIKKNRNLIIGIPAIITIAYEIYLIFSVIVSPVLIGEFSEASIFDVTYRGISQIYLIFIVLLILSTGVLFSRQSLKSDNPELKLKGKLLLSAWILWTAGAILDSAIPLFIFTLLLTRIILISSSILFYLGFLLPNFIKKRIVQ